MSLTNFASPLAFESPEERRKREVGKFLTMAKNVVGGIIGADQERLEAEQAQQRTQEAELFRTEATDMLKRQDDAATFRQNATELIQSRFQDSLDRQQEAERFREEASKLIAPQQMLKEQRERRVGELSPEMSRDITRPAPFLPIGMQEQTEPMARIIGWQGTHPGEPYPDSALQEWALSRLSERNIDQDERDFLTTIVEGAPASVTAAGLGEGKFPSLKEFLTSPVPPEGLEAIGRVPVVGPTARDLTAGMTSPLGLIAAAALGPVSGGVSGLAGMTAKSVAGGVVGNILEEEAGVPYARIAGEFAGPFAPNRAVTAPIRAAARPFERGLAEQGGVRGLGRRALTEEVGGTKIPKGAQEAAEQAPEEMLGIDPLESATTKFRVFAEGQRGKIAKTEVDRGVERGGRIRAAEDAYQDAIAKGMSEEEAVARQQAALRGEYTGVEAEGIGWSADERKAISDSVNSFDFGRGTGPDFERARARVAISKIGKVALQENELETLEKVLPEFAREVRKMQASGFKDWGPALYDLATLQKTVLSAGDASYPGRQGIIISLAHPKEAKQALVSMVKAARNGKVARHMDDLMRADERIVSVTMANGKKTDVTLGEIADSTGLFRELEAGLTSSEEVARSRLAYRIPVIGPIVKMSNRAFATYGNKIRFETAATLLDSWARQGVDITPAKLEALSNALQRESGIGTLKGFVRVPGTKAGVSVGNEALEKALQIPFWAPKYRISHTQFALNLLHPDPQIRALAARDLSIFFGTGMSLLAFVELSGVGETSLNPTSADFGKIKIGNTRINFWGSSQVLARSVAKLATGDVKGAARYFQSGLAPEWSLAYDAYQGKNYLGQPMNMDLETFKREAQQRAIPLAMQDIIDAIEEAARQPTLAKAAVAGGIAPFAMLGGTASTYGESAIKQLKAIPEYGNLTSDQTREIRDFIRQVDEARDFQVEKYGKADTWERAAQKLQGEHNQAFLDWAMALHSNKVKRNPEFIQFLVENEGELRERYDWLYDSRDIEMALYEAKR